MSIFRRIKKNANKGFSLVELIVAVAIMVIVGGATVGFVSTGLNSYASVKNDVDVQNEAQTSLNQIANLLQNAEIGVNYSYVGTVDDGAGNISNVGGQVTSNNEIAAGAVVTEKTLTIYNKTCCYVITFDANNNEITYEKRDRDYTDVGGVITYQNTFAAGTESSLASFIDDFKVSIQNTSNGDILVDMEVDYEKGSDGNAAQRKYTAVKSITLRNGTGLKLNAASADELYGTPTPPVSEPQSIRVTMPGGEVYTDSISGDTPNTTSFVRWIERDSAGAFTGTVDFSFDHKIIGTSGAQNQNIVTTIELSDADYEALGANTDDEKKEAAKSIAEVEGSNTIKVKKDNGTRYDEDGNLIPGVGSFIIHVAVADKPELAVNITVTLKKILRLTIGPGSTAEASFVPGVVIPLETMVEGVTASDEKSLRAYIGVLGDVSNYTADELSVTWAAATASGETAALSTVSASPAKCTLKPDTTNVGHKFAVTATSKGDTNASASYEGTILENATLKLYVTHNRGYGGAYRTSTIDTVNRNQQDIRIYVEDKDGNRKKIINDSNATITIKYKDAAGNVTSTVSATKKNDGYEGYWSFNISDSNAILPYNEACTIDIVVTIGSQKGRATVTVPQVSVTYANAGAGKWGAPASGYVQPIDINLNGLKDSERYASFYRYGYTYYKIDGYDNVGVSFADDATTNRYDGIHQYTDTDYNCVLFGVTSAKQDAVIHAKIKNVTISNSQINIKQSYNLTYDSRTFYIEPSSTSSEQSFVSSNATYYYSVSKISSGDYYQLEIRKGSGAKSYYKYNTSNSTWEALPSQSSGTVANNPNLNYHWNGVNVTLRIPVETTGDNWKTVNQGGSEFRYKTSYNNGDHSYELEIQLKKNNNSWHKSKWFFVWDSEKTTVANWREWSQRNG